jgi:hypothetical protein
MSLNLELYRSMVMHFNRVTFYCFGLSILKVYLLEGLQLGVSLSLMERTTMEKISDGKEQ